MKKIMHVNNTMNIGGIENFLLNVTRNIDLENYNFEFLCYKEDHFDFEDILSSYGCKIYRITDPKKVSKLKHIKELIKIFKNHAVDVVESHTYFESAEVMFAAFLAGVKVRITHSHTTEGLNKVSFFRKIKWNIARILIDFFSTDCVACSKDAGRALFGKKNFKIIENGIDVDKFYYNEEVRKQLREEYHISNTDIILGHIGRFDLAKNHEFLINVLEVLEKKDNNYKLVLVGDGKNIEKIKDLVIQKNLINKVIFVGSVKDTYNYYNIFDLFLFPSIYEGLGMSLIEAQANGLKCLASTNVPIESKITENVQYLDLNNMNIWLDKINQLKSFERSKVNLEDSDYNIKIVVRKLEKIYDKK